MKKKSKRKVKFRQAKSRREGLRDGSIRVSGKARALPNITDDVQARLCTLKKTTVAIMRIYGTQLPGHKARLIQVGPDKFAGYFY